MSIARPLITLLATLLLLGSCAGRQGAEQQAQPPAEGFARSSAFARFDHERHDKPLRRAGWNCVGCHAVGARPELAEDGSRPPTSDDPERSVLLPPGQVCHSCHKRQDVLVPGSAPGRCRVCHEPEQLQPPEDHGAGWSQDHGREALARPARCYDCHLGYRCVRCHVRRDDANSQYHPGTWLSLHGIAARTDPASCETCHEGSTCQQCHKDPSGRQGW